MRQDVNLVSKDYYQEELAYQEQIVRIQNANQLIDKPVIRNIGDVLEIEYEEFIKIEQGSLKLFRPSDPKMDKVFLLKSTETKKMTFYTGELEKGMYRARLQWVMDEKEYFIETVVNI
jgi:hypothetical protein